MDPVSSLDREKWLEENADRLSRMDRLSTSSQNQLASAGVGGQPGIFLYTWFSKHSFSYFII